jgi:hypothetical protein
MAQRERNVAVRAAAAVLLIAVVGLGAFAGCGGGPGIDEPRLGTVSVRNETDQGQAPLTVVEFYIQPVGSPDPGPNRLMADVPPGGVVILGLFPEGLYNAEAVLDNGASVRFMDVEVRANAPTNFVVPTL